jgi:phosphate transport system substrate-binding protein
MLLARLDSPGFAETPQDLPQVKKIFVASLGDGPWVDEVRSRLAKRLGHTRGLEVVSDRAEADLVLKGTARVWVTGYFVTSPRSRGPRQASYGGYLALELVDGHDETLWSYLVTPGGASGSNILEDLAGQMALRVRDALREASDPGEGGTRPGIGPDATIRGAGATFPAPLYQLWFQSFEAREPAVHISYDAVGSQEGLDRLARGDLDFAASDMPLSEEALSRVPRSVVQIPSALGGVVPIYNLGSLEQPLSLTPEALAGIYLGKITRWKDPLIARANRGVSLPDARIVVVHRSDGSGTSFVFTDYLSKVSPEWKGSVGSGTRISWPIGLGAERSDGVVASVQRTPGSIGYVELTYAIQHQASFAAVQNSAGRYVRASLQSVSAAAAGAHASTKANGSITNSPEAAAYPIASLTWLLVPQVADDAGKRDAVAELVRWILTSGQKQCSVLAYAPLPPDVAKDAFLAAQKLR